MNKILIQTNNEEFKKLIEKWRKGNNDISEEIVKLTLLASQATPISL